MTHSAQAFTSWLTLILTDPKEPSSICGLILFEEIKKRDEKTYKVSSFLIIVSTLFIDGKIGKKDNTFLHNNQEGIFNFLMMSSATPETENQRLFLFFI